MTDTPQQTMNASSPASPAPQRGVVLLNFGGPRHLGEVERFIYEILSDPHTLQLPFPQMLQNRLAARIAQRRSPEVSHQYSEIGGASPLVAATEVIRQAVEKGLEGATPGGIPPLWVAHRYLAGWTAELAQQIVASDVQQLLALPLYPHFSYTTTGSSLLQLVQALHQQGYTGTIEVLPAYPDEPAYVKALGDQLEATLSEHSPPKGTTRILASAHGLPASYVKRGDPYQAHLKRTLAALAPRFEGWDLQLCFQSKVGPAEWLRPYTEDAIATAATEGKTHVVFLPLAFVNDHIETLYEIGVTYAGQAQAAGMQALRVPAIEAHPVYTGWLSDVANEWLHGSATQVEPAQRWLPKGQLVRRWGLVVGLSLLVAGFFLVLDYGLGQKVGFW